VILQGLGKPVEEDINELIRIFAKEMAPGIPVVLPSTLLTLLHHLAPSPA
jgi:hypothetical protein